MLQKVLFVAIAAFTLVVSGVAPVVARSHDGLRPVQPNDNRRPAGTTQDGSLILQLRAAFGGLNEERKYATWKPNVWREEWKQHYGPYWGTLVQAIRRYDPDDVFASGPDI